ncbi:hypothetical protein JOF39_001604 [Glutamicibacter protophormiae]|uniref:Glycosyl hydrolases family 38 C-terminal beta sandwich domain-containing protein n=1 Tax=Glutamicibacter protophormiae TaxID=37930 RepID=A0ABS4XPT7_GLUPR|nr:hypothetical protein [Glutamicibacter protophormiae]
MEDPLEPVEVNENSVQLKLGAFEVRTMRFTLA